MKNNDEKKKCLNEEKYNTKTESYSTVKSASQLLPRKCVQLDAYVQTRKRYHSKKATFLRYWRRFLPSWMRTGPVDKGIEAAPITKLSRVQICLKSAQTPKQFGNYIPTTSIL